MTEEVTLKEKRLNKLIRIISFAIPIVVALLFGIKIPNVEPLSFLPPIYATINAVTAILLIAAVVAIKNGRQRTHQRLMTTNIVLSALFLVMYVAYHMTSETTVYGGEGAMKYVYYFILMTHIVLSISVIPLVLITYSKVYLDDFESHRHWAKYTFPIWLYVAITGVLVYIMISPYYQY
jgi:putative membrane protein